MNIFILEDDPRRKEVFKEWFKNEDFIIVEDADAAIELLSKNKYDFIFLDHDLDGRVYVDSKEHNTGYTVAEAISGTLNKTTRVVIHSHNTVGAALMLSVLSENKAEYMPFGSFDENILTTRNE